MRQQTSALQVTQWFTNGRDQCLQLGKPRAPPQRFSIDAVRRQQIQKRTEKKRKEKKRKEKKRNEKKRKEKKRKEKKRKEKTMSFGVNLLRSQV